jgi:hypothetical protein
MEEETEYVCALTGKAAREDEIVHDVREDDDLDQLPIGWLKITVERRVLNPEWLRFAEAKEQLIASQLQAIPPDVPADERAAGERLTRAAIDAQFYAVLAGIPRYVTDTEDVYVKDPDADKQVAEAWGEIAGVLGFDIGVAGDEEEK